MTRVINENKVDALQQYKLGQVEFMKVKTRDGFDMEAMMIKPPDFDPKKNIRFCSMPIPARMLRRRRIAGAETADVASDAGSERLHHLDLRQSHRERQRPGIDLAGL